jgi:hypothetical protein
MAMKMRQSLAQLEQQFWHEAEIDRSRSDHLRRTALLRSRKRSYQRRKKRSSLRFWLLAVSLIATAVIVAAAMFATLYFLLT